MYTNGRKLFPIKVKKRRGKFGGEEAIIFENNKSDSLNDLYVLNALNLWPFSDPVTLTDLVVILINIIYQHPKPSCGETPHAGAS